MQSIIIPIYDRPHHLIETFEGIKQYCVPPYEIILTVDCPKNPEILKVAEEFKQKYFQNMVIIVNPENYDLCTTQNIGMEYALEHSSSEVFIHLEGDIIISTPGWNRFIEDFLMKYKEVGLAVPMTSLRGNFIRRPDYVEAEWALGGTFGIRREVFDDLEGWDENLKHQRECSFCEKIRQKYRVAGCPQVYSWEHLGENDALETDARQALMNIGVHNFLKKMNLKYIGFLYYSSVPTLSWDDFPMNEFFRRQCICGEKLNRNCPKVLIPRGPDGEKVEGWYWDLVYHTRPVNREREEELEKEVRNNKFYTDGEPLEERMKGRSYENLCKEKEISVNWIYVSDDTLSLLKKLKRKRLMLQNYLESYNKQDLIDMIKKLVKYER